MAKLRIKRTITIEADVTVDEDTYPDVTTPEGAKEWEQEQDLVDKLEWFASMMQDAAFPSPDRPHVADANPRGDFSETIVIEG